MNDKILQLLVQSGLLINVSEHRVSELDPNIKKFAELVWTDGYKEGMNMMIRAQLDNPIFSKAMDEHYESKWAHRFD